VSEQGEDAHWFAGKDLPVLIYKVNRRPVGADPMLFKPPPSVLRHLARALTRENKPVRSGRRFQRDWRVGNVAVDGARGTLTGMLGWSRSGEELRNVWDDDERAWRDVVVPSEASAVAPFAFVKDRRFLGVLRHPSFEENTVQWVLTELLNRAEQSTGMPLVSWAVEPVGDPSEFFGWLDSADTVTELKFVFERPNPDAESAFEDLFERLDRLEAEKIRETVTARDPEVGLSKEGLRSDRVTQGFIAAAMAAFGFVVGTGYRGGKRVDYDQRHQALREPVTDLPGDWEPATDEVLRAVRRVSLRHRKGNG
jgi:hypothetical protein